MQRHLHEIAEDPLRHPAVDHVRKGYRRCVCGSHSIYYRVDGQIVEIMRLLSREDIRKALT
ncbi:MAG: type II toxin-antitoxin system RelE/ParE family toxin [Gammaproteobacteria bacterium]|nr:type II toxin-antitoxin system RelE/ParE family toxin [Gammaproteobacteria bacterium]